MVARRLFLLLKVAMSYAACSVSRRALRVAVRRSLRGCDGREGRGVAGK